jgi:purine-nucleoside phosphorylase
MRSESQKAADAIREWTGGDPVNLGLVLGTGLAGLADQVVSPAHFAYRDLPGFPSTVASQKDPELIVGGLGTARVAVLKGRALYHDTNDMSAMRVPLETLKLLGAEGVVLVNSAGSTRPEIAPGALVAIKDHINLTGENPLLQERGDNRFTDMRGAYDGMMRERFALAAHGVGRKVSEGTFMWFSGPSFETPAEINAARILGADLVGMSLVPDVMIARSIGLRVLAIAMVTGYAAGVGSNPTEREDNRRIAGAMAGFTMRVLTKFFEIWVVGSPSMRRTAEG